MSPIIPEDLVEFLESGIATHVGTCNANGRPSIDEACGTLIHADRRRVTVFLYEPVAGRTIANVRELGPISVVYSRFIDHRSIQLKGRTVEVRPSLEGDRKLLERYQVAFVEQLHLIGIPRSIGTRFPFWPSVAITYEVEDLFQQTPGPGTGGRLVTR